ncbi:patatin-like phospholipase family protein [Pseudomonas mosselii]|uniref:patatin-like phospholipase family protein n=1 Tax=Pseudomonas mosselii TaxID=78327 RepID=UPI0021DAE0E5|nr:patatin-like phospholipase family protein [Pseudomonas mosselii]MCU9528712.1 patatin-like phospholipase family protein [Pseudomonas mosselii]MCU9536047.1 patatin-like phospholipase family protein [Pseudomonas mosselii]MCU9541682.1 patatin-like phospholipase family protein [Pseudomonas mosselii]MCU9547641.1 patatin-like phospholipase family protein [Pseudomonas mosselii]
MQEAIRSKIKSPGPKKILSCDGGGIRGLITIQVLLKLEADLRLARQDPQLVLSDYFDFVCGTSTGAIIASCISAGMPMADIHKFYTESGSDMFKPSAIYKRLHYSYDSDPLVEKLKFSLNKVLSHGVSGSDPDVKLGTSKLRTLLMLVLRNHSTDSPWPVSNNPFAKYNDANNPHCNLNLPLWQLIRASTAAPIYFPPEVVTWGEGTEHELSHVFVDGGLTTYNNPAFLAFQMATNSSYAINWEVGHENLLLVSVGTGMIQNPRDDISTIEMHRGHHALNLPHALMTAASAGWDMACRTVGACRYGHSIDSEFGCSIHDESDLELSGKLFTYVRYNPILESNELAELDLKDIDVDAIKKLDAVDSMPDLVRVGSKYAARHVSISHLRGFV